MTNQYKLVVFLFIFLSVPYFSIAQNSTLNAELRYEINQLYPSISHTKKAVNTASTIVDLNPYYKPTWIKKYISVEVSAKQQGQLKKAISKNEVLTQTQKNIIKKADVGTEIAVKVRYIPNNTLKQNEAKEINFSFSVEPENNATYIGGQHQLTKYLEQKAINKIPANTFTGYKLAAIKFTVNEEGKVQDVHVFESCRNEKIDNLLLTAIRNMPRWKPATYASGTAIKQEFALTVGNHQNCMINLLNIRRD